MPSREYERSHPWIRFEADLRAAPPRLWALLGQAVAFCRQVADSALPPRAAEEMRKVYLVKGVQATTAIEGNTLSAEQIRERVEGRLDLPPSQEYLGREVDNVLRACNEIAATIVVGGTLQLTPDWIAGCCNRQVLDGLEAHLEEGVVPGEIPAHAVGVGRYRGDPLGFIVYAAQGLVDGLKEQCRYIDARQTAIAWRHFVFERFRRKRRSPALERRRELVLALTAREQPAPKAELRRLSPAVAERYAGKTDKTLTRDVNWLVAEDLIERRADGYRARLARMRSFLPPRAAPA